MSIRRLGTSLVEILLVISIIALLASLTFPVLMSAKSRAKQTKSVQQMKQIHLSLMLYCSDQDGEGPLMLGLPPDSASFRKAMNLPRDLFLTGGSAWKSPGQAALYTWMPPALHGDTTYLLPLWKEHVLKTERNPIFLVDETFTKWTGQFSVKDGTGIFFDGHLARRSARGPLSSYSLWED